MPNPDHEATRLADQRDEDIERQDAQRREDLAALRQREREREREQGRREGLDAAHTAEQDRHLATINGSIDDFRAELKDVADKSSAGLTFVAQKLTDLEKEVGKFIAVTEALERKGVSTKMFVLGVGALLVPLIVLVVTLAATAK